MFDGSSSSCAKLQTEVVFFQESFSAFSKILFQRGFFFRIPFPVSFGICLYRKAGRQEGGEEGRKVRRKEGRKARKQGKQGSKASKEARQARKQGKQGSKERRGKEGQGGKDGRWKEKRIE